MSLTFLGIALIVFCFLLIAGLINQYTMGTEGWQRTLEAYRVSHRIYLLEILIAMLQAFPLFFGLTWVGLYAGSGFLLKFARRFDIGFQWFNRRFDIEKKPLQSIGLVAGALVAVLYWLVSRVLHA